MAAKKKSKNSKKAKKAKPAKTKKATKSKKAAKTKKAKKIATPAKAKSKATKAKKVVKVRKPAKRAGRASLLEGEGSFTAARNYDRAQEGFVAENKGKISKMARDAESALEGPEGDDLREAEDEGRAKARG